MDYFIKFMDEIKAEEELKENTKAFIKTALVKETQQKTNENSKVSSLKRGFAMKKLLIAASTVVACAILGVGGYIYYNTPVNYVSLDINPSVELGINAFNSVVSVDGCNDDGELLIKESKLSNLSLEEAIATLVNEADEQGFIAEDGSTVIAVTAESDNEETATELQSKSEEGVNLTLSTKNMAAIVYADCSNLQLRTKAREMGISPGKYKLIEVLQLLDPSITVERYKNAKITDIITKAGELMASVPNSEEKLGGYGKNTEMILEAAKEVQAARVNTEGEQNINNEQEQNQNQGISGPEQEQNQNQEQSPSTSQSQNQGTSIGTQYGDSSLEQNWEQNNLISGNTTK